MDLQTKREGSKQAQQTDDGHPPVGLAASPLSRRVLNVDEGHLHPQQPTECGSQVPRVIFNARGNLAIEPRRREFRLDAREAASHVVHGGGLLGGEPSSVRPLEGGVKAERILTRVPCNGPLGAVSVEEMTDVARPALHLVKVGWRVARCFRGELQLRGLLHCVGDTLDAREHISMQEREIGCEAAVAPERDSQKHSRRGDLHAYERGQTPTDGDSSLSSHTTPVFTRSRAKPSLVTPCRSTDDASGFDSVGQQKAASLARRRRSQCQLTKRGFENLRA